MQVLGLCFSDAAVGAETGHDGALVVLSYFVAALASFTALDMAERLRTAAPSSRRFWHLGAALVLGGGVWSMHFIAMLAYRTPFTAQYDAGLTIISGIIAVVGVAAGLQVLAQKTTAGRILGGGVLVGLSVCTMHYMGMSALRGPGEIYYRPLLFGLSVLIAIAASSAALWLAVTLHTAGQRAIAAAVMAAAICGMHFTGMAGTVIVVAPDLAEAGGDPLVSGSLLAGTIVACMALILGIALMCAYLDRRLEARSLAEAERLRAVNGDLEAAVQSRTVDLTTALAALDEQRRRAEAANRAKSDFLANMSHELRTPLNAVIGFAEVMQMPGGGDVLSRRQAEAVDQIQTAGRHLLALIEEVLDFAKIESGKVSVSIEAIDPQDLAQGLHGSFKLAADRAGVSLEIVAAGEDIAVRADHLRLKQVLSNLISNAIKYNRPNGTVRVEMRAALDRVLLSVADTGLGIPAHRMNDLFEPFERLGREGTGVEGAGLGLALTRRLVEAMSGELRVESRENLGSTFIVDLPAATPDQVEARPAAQAEPVPTGAGPEARVLYIEDNASNIRLMRHIADALGGLDLHVAEHPVQGLELAASLRPDVILLDINLPGMDGFQVKARLEANPATRQIPVIAISANVLAETMTRGQSSGFHGYLTKPISIGALVSAIHDATAPSLGGAVLTA
jgi:signal transduction histidine kinase/ActR/RegA family two-component response regulator